MCLIARPQSLGWKQLPETINGRAAMLGEPHAPGRYFWATTPAVAAPSSDSVNSPFLPHAGFLAGASAELLGAGSLLHQTATQPQPVVLTLALVVAASLIPAVQAAQGKDLASINSSLRSVYR